MGKDQNSGEKQSLILKDEEKNKTRKSEIDNEADDKNEWIKEILGFLLCVVGCGFAAFGAMCVRKLDGLVPDIELNGLRYAAIIIATIPYFLVKKQFPSIKDDKELTKWQIWIWLIIFTIPGFFANLLHFMSVRYINLVKSLSVTVIVTMVSAALVTRFLLKLRVTMAEIIAIVIGTCGALMIFQKDIFVIQVEDQSRFVSDTILNNVNQTNPRYSINNSTFTVKNNGSFNGDLDFNKKYMEYELNIAHTKANVSDNHKSSGKILELEMDGRTTLEKTNHWHLLIGIILSGICGLMNPWHGTLQKTKLKNLDVWILIFWYSIFGCISSLGVSAIFEKMNLPSSTRDWGFLIGHCIGGAVFVGSVRVAQQMASLMTISLALGFHMVWYLVAQEIFFFEKSTTLGTIIEIIGTLLVVVSAVLEPIRKIVVHHQTKNNADVSDEAVTEPDKGS